LFDEFGGLDDREELATWERSFVVEDLDVDEGLQGPTSIRTVVALPASERDRPSPGPTFFRLGAGRGTLARLDLGQCSDLGLPSGYMRMRVTFHPNGRVSHAAVQSDMPPSRAALACIGHQLMSISVPPFDGRAVTLSRTLYVAGGATDEAAVSRVLYLQSTR
jgi:hypothetical protein